MEGEEKKSGRAVIGIAVAVAVVAVAYGLYKYATKEDDSFSDDFIQKVESKTKIPVETKQNVTTSYLYNNGGYSVVGAYNSPAGSESIGVQLSLKDDMVTDVSVTAKATNETSLKFQKIVSENIKSLVVGKKLDEVKLDKVSGSSLTPKGFNDAIAKIKVQAKA